MSMISRQRLLLLSASLAGALLTGGPSNAQPVARSPFSSASASFTRPNGTSCCTAGQAIANATLAASVVPMSFNLGRTLGALYGAKVLSSNTGLTGGTVTLRVYTASPTVAAGDGAAFSTNDSGWLCDITIPLNGTAFTDGTAGYGTPATGPICPIPANTPKLYGLLVAGSAFTSVASSTWALTVYGQ